MLLQRGGAGFTLCGAEKAEIGLSHSSRSELIYQLEERSWLCRKEDIPVQEPVYADPTMHCRHRVFHSAPNAANRSSRIVFVLPAANTRAELFLVLTLK